MINWKHNEKPELPYYASIFNYYLAEDLTGYTEMDDLTLELAMEVDGFLGYESHKSQGRGSFISYWKNLEAIDQWRKDSTHLLAKAAGKKRWYSYYHAMIAKVESAHFHDMHGSDQEK
jgi:heme-degrading monooxygenase HmoA